MQRLSISEAALAIGNTLLLQGYSPNEITVIGNSVASLQGQVLSSSFGRLSTIDGGGAALSLAIARALFLSTADEKSGKPEPAII